MQYCLNNNQSSFEWVLPFRYLGFFCSLGTRGYIDIQVLNRKKM